MVTSHVNGLITTGLPRFNALLGVGGIGAGILFALEDDRDLGRNESRAARLLETRDYCKLHIIAHFTGLLAGARVEGVPFHVLPIGKVGADPAGERLVCEMKSAGMDCRFVEALSGVPTLFAVCYQFPDGSGGNLTPTNAAAAQLRECDLDAAQPLLDRYGRRAIVLAAPEVPLSRRSSWLKRGSRVGAFRVASFVTGEMEAVRQEGLLGQVDLLALNEDEAAALTGIPYQADAPAPLLKALAAIGRPEMGVLLTVGPDGVYGYADGRWIHRPALPIRPVSTAGAGDTLLGGVLACLAAGHPFLPKDGEPPRLSVALDVGNLAAGLSIRSPHTIDPDLTLGLLHTEAPRFGYRLD